MEYFFFANPDIQDIKFFLYPIGIRDSETLETFLDGWLDKYTLAAHNFYRSQYLRHEEILEKEFCKIHDINLKYFSPSYPLDREWEQYRRIHGLDHHYQLWQTEAFKLDKLYPRHTLTTAQLIDEHYKWVQLIIMQRSDDPERSLDVLWFNNTINNSIEEQNELLKLKKTNGYQAYLKTSHWQKVRRAMWLIHNAQCEECIYSESYWREESLLNVHRITYKNLGSERFQDLRLLCANCHKHTHRK